MSQKRKSFWHFIVIERQTLFFFFQFQKELVRRVERVKQRLTKSRVLDEFSNCVIVCSHEVMNFSTEVWGQWHSETNPSLYPVVAILEYHIEIWWNHEYHWMTVSSWQFAWVMTQTVEIIVYVMATVLCAITNIRNLRYYIIHRWEVVANI